MGVSAIDDVFERVQHADFQQMLQRSKREHMELKHEVGGLLNSYHDDGKDPNPIAQGMTKVKTGLKLAVDASDEMIADLITDGCDMGVKSLSRYLNQYEAADERSKDIAKRLIRIETNLAADVRTYL